MPELLSQDWEYAKPYYGKTLRVHRIDLNDHTAIQKLAEKYRSTGAFRAHPALNVKITGEDGRYLPLDGTLVLILEPRKGGDVP